VGDRLEKQEQPPVGGREPKSVVGAVLTSLRH
jgi:hypothetical protein